MSITHNQACVMSAMLARSNMGQFPVSDDKIRWLKNLGPAVTVSGCVYNLCDDLMETDEHEEIFLGEARMFHQQLLQDGEKTREYWGEAWDQYERA